FAGVGMRPRTTSKVDPIGIAGYMREVSGPMLEALGSLPSDFVLGTMQSRLMTAMAGVGYDPSAIHYLLAQQSLLNEEQKLGFLMEVLQRVTGAPNSLAPAQVKHVIRDARVAAQGEDSTPPQAVHGLARV